MPAKTIISSLLRAPAISRQNVCFQCRSLHRLNAIPNTVPKPIPFVPDVPTFLKLIGRSLSKHAAEIPSWEALFTWSSDQLKEAGVEPARTRRYLLWWRERYRNGIYGMGGDLKFVKDGVAELKVVQVTAPTDNAHLTAGTLSQDPGMMKVVINTESAIDEEKGKGALEGLAPPAHMSLQQANKVQVRGIKLFRTNTIGGTGVEQVKGRTGVARLRVTEGLWEQRRGHKVDGGERRQAMVRSKRRAAERKNAK
ncbi:uncharacterized protein K489DRAFT_393453 [Dissoconium aciculare CBS 342.82]|uniref:Small ribosomal subunit protein mS41 n=1 Tax=Dissoconium aciculare CBS 342.82 TaxID=1314786 RepID=A0A6J3M8T2_9PEZI|nr:uncharacterized protein K489DRAFT_393453 [Dissoconium aciculare CBS 342.82]KAF1824009.1 hypothetical protein K489DRAFT_393453 [Dissoconium aciculare CBS 342.82]